MEPITPHGLAVIAISAVAFFLLARGKLSVELFSLLILAGLASLFQAFPFMRNGVKVSPTGFFFGFGHEALIAICCLMIHGHALVSTGALEPVSRIVGRLWAWSSALALLSVLLISVALSSVINDTPVVVLMIPILVSVALRTGTAPSKTLMPMNFAVLAGGMTTTIGTSTNLLVVSIASDLGVEPFGMFEFTTLALTATAPAVLYLWLIAPRLLSDRRPPMESTAQRTFQAVLHVDDGSYPDGRTVAEVLERTGRRMHIDKIERASGDIVMRMPTVRFLVGDKIFIRDTRANIKEFEHALDVMLHEAKSAEAEQTEGQKKTTDGEQLAEVVITDHSWLAGRTLRDVRFFDRFGLLVIALHRPPSGEVLARALGEQELHSGDVLLVQGPVEQVAKLKSDPSLLVLDGSAVLPHTRKAPHALLIMLGVVAAAGAGLVPIYVGAVIGVIALLLTRTVLVENLGRALKADVILMIAASLALGRALTETGVAQTAGVGIAQLTISLPPGVILGVLMAVMAIFTNFVSNNAAAAVGTPLAVSLASQLGLPPEPFVLAVLFGCNLSFVTPMGYQTNILIMATANYKFSDYVKVGLPLAAMLASILAYTLAGRYF